MSTTFTFEELDDATREYLTEVREREGRGTPGVFAPVTASLAGCGCIMGPILIITTLCGTMFTDIILGDPDGVALLQTAGLLLGGWMLIAAFRIWGGKNSPKRAGQASSPMMLSRKLTPSACQFRSRGCSLRA